MFQPLFRELHEFLFKLFLVRLDAMILYFSSLPSIIEFLTNLRYVVSLQSPNIMSPKKKVRHGSTSTAPEEVPHNPFMPHHPSDENECDKLIVKCLIIVEHIILIVGFKEHGVAKLLDFYKLRPFLQLT